MGEGRRVRNETKPDASLSSLPSFPHLTSHQFWRIWEAQPLAKRKPLRTVVDEGEMSGGIIR